MIGSLLAYDVNGDIIATLDHLVARDAGGNVLGLVDFSAIEEAGRELTEVWTVSGAVGSKVWPEWLGGRAHAYRVELEGEPGRKRIAALVHRDTAERRERAAIEAAIAERIAAAGEGPVDLRDIVGGPDRPLRV